jgi:hypothetical protein
MSKMSNQSPSLAVAIAIVAGAIGYQSGSKAVDKDYVQMAMTNLANKETSPELRQWSVQILNKLAPVPLSQKLQDQLVTTQYITPQIIIPKVAAPCPDLIKQDQGKQIDPTDLEAHNRIFVRWVNAYEDCRIKHDLLGKYLHDLNKIRLDGSAATSK